MTFDLPTDYVRRAQIVTRHGLAVTLPDGRVYRLTRMITTGNPKLDKSVPYGFLSAGLTLAPVNQAQMGSVCAFASPQCAAVCLDSAGQGGIVLSTGDRPAQLARIARTRALLSREEDERANAWSMLVSELELFVGRALRLGLRPTIRLNVLSDLPWHKMAPWLLKSLARKGARLYDYTKDVKRPIEVDRQLWDLTISRSELLRDEDYDYLLSRKERLAVVFRKHIPATWRQWPVIDGDRHDLRFSDPLGVVVGLKAKGHARYAGSGFVVGGEDEASGTTPSA